MEVKDIVALAITGAIGIVLIVMSIIMLSGRGANLIAGYAALCGGCGGRADGADLPGYGKKGGYAEK